MNLPIKICSLVLFIGPLILLLGQTDAQRKPKELPVPLAHCKRIMGRVMKLSLKAFGQCSRKLKNEVSADNRLFEKKIGCVVKCTLTHLDLLDGKGKVTRDSIQKFNDRVMPPEVHDFAQELAADCAAEAEKLDTTEDHCQTYAVYAQCMQNVVGDFAESTDCHPQTPH